MTKAKKKSKVSKNKRNRIVVNIVQTCVLLYGMSLAILLTLSSFTGENWKIGVIPLCVFGTICFIDYIDSVAKALGLVKS